MKIYQKKCRFSDTYSRNNLTKMKHGASVINLDEYKLIGTYWIAFICEQC